MSSRAVVSGRNLPICTTEYPASHRNEAEDQRKHKVCFECEDEEREQGEAPDNQIQRDHCVEFLRGRSFCGVSGGRVRRSKSERRKLQHPKRKPEDSKESLDHHREEIAHNPFEDCAEDEENWPDEEEDTSADEVSLALESTERR